MSETTKKVTNQETEQEPKTAASKKPAKKPEKTEEKVGFFKRIGRWCGRHKEALITGGIAFVGGAATTAGAGIVMNKRAERKARQQATYIPEQEDVSPFDPNV